MKPSVYLETTIPSDLTARPTRDLVQTAHQQVTRDWWAERAGFELFISQFVLDECGAGDPQAAADCLAALAGIVLLEQVEAAKNLVAALMREVHLPPRAIDDATHIAIASAHQVDYLLTWNCRHIANATLRPRIEATCRARGCRPPIICTPPELLGRDYSDD